MVSAVHSRLIELAFATFHTGLLFLVSVTLTYAGGALGDALASLNTLIGVGAFILFWLAIWLTGHQVMNGTSNTLAETHYVTLSRRRILFRGAVWGGIEGLTFLFVSLSVFLIFTPVASNATLVPATVVEGLVFDVVAGVAGSPFAFVIGAAVGVLFVIIDLILLGLAQFLYSYVQTPQATTTAS